MDEEQFYGKYYEFLKETENHVTNIIKTAIIFFLIIDYLYLTIPNICSTSSCFFSITSASVLSIWSYPKRCIML